MDSNSGDSRHSATFNLVVKNFTNSFSKNRTLCSLPCIIRNIPWRLEAYSHFEKNEFNQREKYLAIHLRCLADDEGISDCVCHRHWNCSAKVKLSILHKNDDDKNEVREFSQVFHSTYRCPGYDTFISWDRVTNPLNGFIEENTVYIQAEVVVDTPVGINYKVKNDNNESQSELLESKRKILSLESEVAQLKSDLALEKCNALHMQKDLPDEKSEIQLLKNDMAKEKAELQLLKNDVAKEKAELQQLKNDVASEKADVRSKMKTLETIITNVVSQISEIKNVKESVSQNGSASSSTGDLRSEFKEALLLLINSKFD